MARPLLAIVGRPNVGKSTLFNRLAKRRRAIVHDHPGVTRDRLYEEIEWEEHRFILVDTGGFEIGSDDPMQSKTSEHVEFAVQEADFVIFMTDVKDGLLESDHQVVRRLRESGKQFVFAVNKVDGPKWDQHVFEFYGMGAESLFPISAEHGLGIGDLMDEVLLRMKEKFDEEPDEIEGIGIAVVGRPNTGKSTLVNALIGSSRMIVDDTPGTTRDSIDTKIVIGAKRYTLVDTAGIRRRSRVTVGLEKICVIKALKSLDRARIALILIDAEEGPTLQDARIAGYARDYGCGCILLVNKWDLIGRRGRAVRDDFSEDLRRKIKGLAFAPMLFISARRGNKVDSVLPLVDRVAEAHGRRIKTPDLNRLLADLEENHSHPLGRTGPIRFYYISQIGMMPPVFAVVTNHPEQIRDAYRRYLINGIREAFGFEGTPIKVVFRPRGQKKKGRWPKKGTSVE
ncbi:ribosome biogenesis GTPase Der [Thermodesulfobacteriota bacterium]